MKLSVRGPAPCDLVPVRRAIRAALRRYGLPADAQIAVAFVADDEMRALNARYRGKRRVTDVLSFGQDLRGAKGEPAVDRLRRDADGGLDVGDIVISAAQAQRQARRRRQPLVREVTFLGAHGALHLLGFEDDTPTGYREMVQLGTAATDAALAQSRR
ncbi:MAG TPA: rRNA maturation RNase YbeY [Candidatus Limnocylindria bacterium]|nr:rRNA maturation RNase YbeY [Candidatus Limnocylindria bacterium]